MFSAICDWFCTDASLLMPPIARGRTWLCQPLSVSTVPHTGRNLSNSKYRGLDEEEVVNMWVLTCVANLYSLIILVSNVTRLKRVAKIEASVSFGIHSTQQDTIFGYS